MILNWYDRDDSQETPGLAAYLHYVRLALRYDCNVVLLAARRSDFEAIEAIPPRDGRIDVWYADAKVTEKTRSKVAKASGDPERLAEIETALAQAEQQEEKAAA